MLRLGTTVKSKVYGIDYTVMRLLGQGGQGYVFEIENPIYGKKALKWYFQEQATMEQKANIINLINMGPPGGSKNRTYVWQQDLVEYGDGFGYVMDLIDMNKYVELGRMLSNPELVPSQRQRCIISYKLVDSYHLLHLKGYCYRDISDGNFLFNPKTGDVLICDNDNIGIEGQSSSQILGTLEYMAPEIIRGKAKPSISTDLYSLAILLFRFWVWHHPYHGSLEYNIKSWDIPAKRRIYGEMPIFIFDPKDTRNKLPDDGAYDAVKFMWNTVPNPLQNLFMISFTTGILDPATRIYEHQWKTCFRQLLSAICYCPSDGAEVFLTDTNNTRLTCWSCGNVFEAPSVLRIVGPAGRQLIAITQTARIYGYNIDEFSKEFEPLQELSRVTQNPNNPSIWGFLNLTDSNWEYIFPDGKQSLVPPGKNAPIMFGATIKFYEGISGRIERSQGVPEI